MPNDTTAKRYAVKLTKFRFPKTDEPPYKLEDDQLDFRLQVDLRYMDSAGAFAVKTVILPGLDRFWECSAEMQAALAKKPKPDHVYARADDELGPHLDIGRVGAWDNYVQGVRMRVVRDAGDRVRRGARQLARSHMGRAAWDWAGHRTDSAGWRAGENRKKRERMDVEVRS